MSESNLHLCVGFDPSHGADRSALAVFENGRLVEVIFDREAEAMVDYLTPHQNHPDGQNKP